ncbi:Uncharacterised protein [uncultured archaeon]|nr:Uncharacterised protein [uncultured archaeon]
MQGLENISIKVAPLRIKPGAAQSLQDVLCPGQGILEQTAEKTELRDSDYPNIIQKILYSAAIRHRELRLEASKY